MENGQLKELCAYILENPESIIQVHRHRILKGVWRQNPHSHENLIQFDFFSSCEGTLVLDDERHAIKDNTAAIYYTGVQHSYEIRPPKSSSGATAYTIKLKAPPELGFASDRPVPAVQHVQPPCRELLTALDRLYTVSLNLKCNRMLKLSLLMETLALWPDGKNHDSETGAMNASTNIRSEDPFERALDMIENFLDKPLKVEDLAREAGLSRRQMERRFKESFGLGPQEFINNRKLKVVKEQMAQGRKPFHVLAKELGFKSVHHFSRWFSRCAGASPSAFRKSLETL